MDFDKMAYLAVVLDDAVNTFKDAPPSLVDISNHAVQVGAKYADEGFVDIFGELLFIDKNKTISLGFPFFFPAVLGATKQEVQAYLFFRYAVKHQKMFISNLHEFQMFCYMFKEVDDINSFPLQISLQNYTCLDVAEIIQYVRPRLEIYCRIYNQAGNENETVDVLIVGDNINTGIHSNSPNWVVDACGDVKKLNARVINAAVPGITSEYVAQNLNMLLRTYKPAALVLNVGANDVLFQINPKKMLSDFKSILKTCLRYPKYMPITIGFGMNGAMASQSQASLETFKFFMDKKGLFGKLHEFAFGFREPINLKTVNYLDLDGSLYAFSRENCNEPQAINRIRNLDVVNPRKPGMLQSTLAEIFLDSVLCVKEMQILQRHDLHVASYVTRRMLYGENAFHFILTMGPNKESCFEELYLAVHKRLSERDIHGSLPADKVPANVSQVIANGVKYFS